MVCGNDFTCPYTNYCEANLAGFVESQCRPLNAAGCPVPGTGSSDGEACTANENPVACGTNNDCVYANECVAQSVGFLAGCTSVADGEPANPIEPAADCPVPGTGSSAGEACTADENPVRCGLYYQCVYSNECVANSVGFLAGCIPLADGEPANPIEPGIGNVPTTTSEQPDTSAGVVLAVGNLAIAAFFSTVFF